MYMYVAIHCVSESEYLCLPGFYMKFSCGKMLVAEEFCVYVCIVCVCVCVHACMRFFSCKWGGMDLFVTVWCVQ